MRWQCGDEAARQRRRNPGNIFSVGKNPHGVAFDGANIWVANLKATT
jgi:hypothetical protein